MAEVRKGGKKNRKYGRDGRKPKHAKYVRTMQYERNKIKRIIRANGEKGVNIAREWAKEHNCLHIWREVTGAKA